MSKLDNMIRAVEASIEDKELRESIIRILVNSKVEESYENQSDFSELSFEQFCELVVQESSKSGFADAISSSNTDALDRVFDIYEKWVEYVRNSGDTSKTGVMRHVKLCLGTYSRFYDIVTESNIKEYYSVSKFISDLSVASSNTHSSEVEDYVLSHIELYDKFVSDMIGKYVCEIPDEKLLRVLADNLEKELLV